METKQNCIYTGKHLYRDKGNSFFTINVSSANSSRFEFATELTAFSAADLNFRAFKNNQFGTSFEDKMQRNLSHIKQNKLSIMLIKSSLTAKYIAFTHILPVNKDVWNNYIDGEISDNEFPADYVFSDIDHLAEPYGLIIFSIASAGIHTELKADLNYRDTLGKLLEQATVYHINALLNAFFKHKKIVPALFQNNSDECLNYFENTDYTFNRISKDNERIIIFNILNEPVNL